MGIKVEYNPDLALRAYGTPERTNAECLPQKLLAGRVHHFLKQGQRNYWLEGNIPLLETKGDSRLSRPLASITILEATHFVSEQTQEVYTRGIYRINEVFNPDSRPIHFEGFQEVKLRGAKK